MISHNKFFFIGKNLVLLLISGDNHLNTFFQVGLSGKFSSVTDSPKSRLVYNISQVGTGSSGSRLGNIAEIHIIGNFDLSGVNLKDFLSSLQIRKFYRDPTVETSRS